MTPARLEMFKVWVKLSVYSLGGLIAVLLMLLGALLIG